MHLCPLSHSMDARAGMQAASCSLPFLLLSAGFYVMCSDTCALVRSSLAGEVMQFMTSCGDCCPGTEVLLCTFGVQLLIGVAV
jgi:hypothetical protein